MGKIDLIPIYNRPREKAYINGVNSLSDNELLAIIIQSGTKNKSAIDISICAVVTLLPLVPSFITRKFMRWQGAILLCIYLAYFCITCGLITVTI